MASPSQGCPRKNGYFSHQDCDKYFFCNDGVANLYPCPGGLVFAPDKGQCTWIEEANRPGCKSKDTFEFSCPEVGPNEHPRYPDPEGYFSFHQKNNPKVFPKIAASSMCASLAVPTTAAAPRDWCSTLRAWPVIDKRP